MLLGFRGSNRNPGWPDLRHAAVNEHFASGHEVAVVRGKEERHGSRLLWTRIERYGKFDDRSLYAPVAAVRELLGDSTPATLRYRACARLTSHPISVFVTCLRTNVAAIILELPMRATSEDVGRPAVGVVAGIGDELVIESELGRRFNA